MQRIIITSIMNHNIANKILEYYHKHELDIVPQYAQCRNGDYCLVNLSVILRSHIVETHFILKIWPPIYSHSDLTSLDRWHNSISSLLLEEIGCIDLSNPPIEGMPKRGIFFDKDKLTFHDPYDPYYPYYPYEYKTYAILDRKTYGPLLAKKLSEVLIEIREKLK